MKKNILKKISIGLLSAAMMVSMTACNTKIKVNYDYNAEDYVTLGEYKGIEVSVDTDAIENNLIIQEYRMILRVIQHMLKQQELPRLMIKLQLILRVQSVVSRYPASVIMITLLYLEKIHSRLKGLLMNFTE